jgi:hypothetical protein
VDVHHTARKVRLANYSMSTLVQGQCILGGKRGYDLSHSCRLSIDCALVSQLGNSSGRVQTTEGETRRTCSADDLSPLEHTTCQGLPATLGLATTALVVLEIVTAQPAEAENGVCACQAVDGERSHASCGRDPHHWIERMSGGVIGATGDIRTLRCVGVQMRCMMDAMLAQVNFAPAGKGYILYHYYAHGGYARRYQHADSIMLPLGCALYTRLLRRERGGAVQDLCYCSSPGSSHCLSSL